MPDMNEPSRSSRGEPPLAFHLLTPVWGAEYIRLLTDLGDLIRDYFLDISIDEIMAREEREQLAEDKADEL